MKRRKSILFFSMRVYRELIKPRRGEERRGEERRGLTEVQPMFLIGLHTLFE